ncbi:uncharacterized protein LOC129187811 isoform X1 [Dunckerocampus dactyliophorus]|uniref:uncharacterized protein LOC129187811 isoform X1 n=1 Tax=Dunckerocampus dactyliophorus TaxID=161453 RepID=UPI0024055BCC|nr:uncharacterized protein LOC129187811 isoform X1 [Dunckerocampus dactyliophorus]XP_054643497.1 uncharacterized protein LOC129187811 isoform X1 [Dunckerocampus dactyliophorus]XP_054643498.1 uncharacterized protein LOC129187811 isoform X1 [Dunckerocampus dactyliophorus]XP_054643499.1 uncharacterized protein LOC129187811 isoform X1 [Dunckerocampus dactyliophorus]
MEERQDGVFSQWSAPSVTHWVSWHHTLRYLNCCCSKCADKIYLGIIPFQKKCQSVGLHGSEGLEKIGSFKMERCCIKLSSFKGLLQAKLHHFENGSDHAYGTVSYLRLQDVKGRVHLAFMLGKARVAQLEQTTILRLELTAPLLAAKVDKMLKRELSLQLNSSCFWTDSQTVLKYISNNSKRFDTFVANKVAVIREATEVCQWRYIESKLNPADEASRGLNADSFTSCQRWINGPDFLRNPEQEWPEPFEPQLVSSQDPEVKRDILITVTDIQLEDPTTRLVHYFSSWAKLKASVALFLKLKDALLGLSRNREEMSALLVVDPTAYGGKRRRK